MSPEKNKTLTCPFCGTHISSSDTTCKNCGKKLTKEIKNGAKKGLGRALSEKYWGRITKAEKKRKKRKAVAEGKEISLGMFSLLPDVGRSRAEALWDAGFKSFEDLQKASVDDIANVKGIGPALAEKIKENLPKPEKGLEKAGLLICSIAVHFLLKARPAAACVDPK